MLALIFSFLLIALNNLDSSQYLNKCETVYGIIISQVKKPDREILSDFIINRPMYRNNAEYEEWRSELIFDLLACYPADMVEVIAGLNPEQRRSIYKEIQEPVYEFDYMTIKQLIENVSQYKSVVNEISSILSGLVQCGNCVETTCYFTSTKNIITTKFPSNKRYLIASLLYRVKIISINAEEAKIEAIHKNGEIERAVVNLNDLVIYFNNTKDSIILYRDPNELSSHLFVFYDGQRLGENKVLAEKNGWIKIRCKENSNIEGWINPKDQADLANYEYQLLSYMSLCYEMHMPPMKDALSDFLRIDSSNKIVEEWKKIILSHLIDVS